MSAPNAVLGRENIVKIRIRAILTGVLGLALIVSQAPTANANAVSSWGYYSASGKGYRNQAGAWVIYPGQADVSTYVGPQSGYSIPAGWMSARGRMFTESGALYCEGGNVYNGGTISYPNLTNGTACRRYGSGFNFYSYGVTKSWDGNGSYGNWFTFKSPMQST